MINPLANDLAFVLAHTKELWEELRGQRIFITGGTGFFGAWLLESFVWANEQLDLKAEAYVLTRDVSAFSKKCPHLAKHPALKFVAGDVRDFAFPRENFSHVIHAATDAGGAKVNESDPMLMLDTIVGGTRRVLDLAVHCGAKKFLLASSGAIYGPQLSEIMRIPEEFLGGPNPLDIRSAYGEGKRMAEAMCAVYSQQFGIETKVARCFAFVGPHLPLDANFAIGNFIRDAMRGGPIVISGDGTPERSYLYAADLMIWLWTILIRGVAGRPYNVGSSENLSIRQLAEKVSGVFDNQIEVRVAQNPMAGKPPVRYVPATNRAETELNLVQRVSVEESIRKTVEWLRRGA